MRSFWLGNGCCLLMTGSSPAPLLKLQQQDWVRAFEEENIQADLDHKSKRTTAATEKEQLHLQAGNLQPFLVKDIVYVSLQFQSCSSFFDCLIAPHYCKATCSDAHGRFYASQPASLSCRIIAVMPPCSASPSELFDIVCIALRALLLFCLLLSCCPAHPG